MIKMYCDGSSKANGQANNTGGYGLAVFRDDMLIYHYGEQCIDTTNNREELKALIHALRLSQSTFKEEVCVIYSDSAYVVNMCNEWIRNWARNHWMNSKKVEVENIDLVKEIYNYIALDFPNFQITKVPGHAGVLGNELADALATNNKAKFDKILSENDISGRMEIFFDF